MTDLPLSQSGKSALDIATEAAKEAAKLLLSHFHTENEIKSKGRGNLVTEADILSEKALVRILKNEYPSYSILSEESAPPQLTTDYSWIIDPLDGTNNYVFGIPFFCINVALVRGEDILLGITYDPVREELFQAEKGKGAHVNGLPMSVSKKDSLQASLVGFDLGYDAGRGKEILDIINRLWPGVHSLRLMGSASLGLAYVACGRVDLYAHRYIYPWDIASGILLVREAGGVVTDWQGREVGITTQEIIVSNSRLHLEFMRLIKDGAFE